MIRGGRGKSGPGLAVTDQKARPRLHQDARGGAQGRAQGIQFPFFEDDQQGSRAAPQGDHNLLPGSGNRHPPAGIPGNPVQGAKGDDEGILPRQFCGSHGQVAG